MRVTSNISTHPRFLSRLPSQHHSTLLPPRQSCRTSEQAVVEGRAGSPGPSKRERKCCVLHLLHFLNVWAYKLKNTLRGSLTSVFLPGFPQVGREARAAR